MATQGPPFKLFSWPMRQLRKNEADWQLVQSLPPIAHTSHALYIAVI